MRRGRQTYCYTARRKTCFAQHFSWRADNESSTGQLATNASQYPTHTVANGGDSLTLMQKFLFPPPIFYKQMQKWITNAGDVGLKHHDCLPDLSSLSCFQCQWSQYSTVTFHLNCGIRGLKSTCYGLVHMITYHIGYFFQIYLSLRSTRISAYFKTVWIIRS